MHPKYKVLLQVENNKALVVHYFGNFADERIYSETNSFSEDKNETKIQVFFPFRYAGKSDSTSIVNGFGEVLETFY